jgi:hypothetical protein
MPNGLLDFFADPVERANIRQGFMDAVNRGAVGAALGAPVDMANMLLNLGKAGYGYVGNKTGLLSVDQMPELIDNPVGGSEYIGRKMQDAGMVSDKRNQLAEALAGFLPMSPTTSAKAVAAIGAGGLLGMPGVDAAAFAGVRRAEQELAALKSAGVVDDAGNTWQLARHPATGAPTWSSRVGRVVLPDSNRRGVVQEFADPQRLSDYRTEILQGLRNLDDERAAAALISQPKIYEQPAWARQLTETAPNLAADRQFWEKALLPKDAINAFAETSQSTPRGLLYGPGTKSANASEVASSLGGTRPIQAQWTGDNLKFSNGTGSLQVLDANTQPVIRSLDAQSSGKPDGGGKQLYQAAMQWLANNNRLALPDSGLSDINHLRKIGNELSSQVRNGKPTAFMNTDRVSGVSDVPSLWLAESQETRKRAPSMMNLTFDGGGFKLNNTPASDKDISELLKAYDPNFAEGVGAMTAKRAALFDWLHTATPEQARQAAKLIAGGGLLGVGPVFAADQNQRLK